MKTSFQSAPVVDTTTQAAQFLDADGCSAHYGFSPAHWRRLVDAGKAPQPTRFGHLVRWSIRALDEWDAAGCFPVCVAKGGRG